MVDSQSIRSLLLTGLLSLPVAGLIWLTPESARAQSVSPSGTTQPTEQDLRPLTQESSVLSAQAGQRLMREAAAAVSTQNYDLAVRKLQEARQVYNSLSNFYQQLANSFSGIDIRIADQQRQQALAAAQSRDEATYQLALVHRAQNKPELAVPLLVQIISSQQPTRELGQRAYRQLFELGFVNSPFPRNEGGSTSSTPAPAPAPAPAPRNIPAPAPGNTPAPAPR